MSIHRNFLSESSNTPPELLPSVTEIILIVSGIGVGVGAEVVGVTLVVAIVVVELPVGSVGLETVVVVVVGGGGGGGQLGGAGLATGPPAQGLSCPTITVSFNGGVKKLPGTNGPLPKARY